MGEDSSFYHAKGAPVDPDQDYIVTAIALGGKVRVLSVRTTHICKEALQIHGMSPVATAALGRFLTGSLLLAAGLKGDDSSLTANIRCDGPIKGMTAVCNSRGGVKGYCIEPVVPTVNRAPGKLDVSAAIGKGMLSVVKDLGLKEPYIGTSELISGEIAEDFTYFLAVSEQTRSIMSLGVLMNSTGVLHAGGFLVQLMPEAGEPEIEYLEKRASGGFPDITYLLSEGLSPEHIADMFIGDPDIQFLSGAPVRYDCGCSREKMERNLIALGKKELDELASDPDGIELACHFCGAKYHFRQMEIARLMQ